MRIPRDLLVLPLLASIVACNRDPKEASRKYVDTGNKYFTRAKYKEASIMYRRALQKDLKNPEAYYRLALVDLKQRQFNEAAHSLQRSVQLDPSNTDASAKLADLYFASYIQNPLKRKEELDEVRMIADTLLKKNPKSYDGLRLRAFIALADKNLPEAIREFEAARQIKPNQPELILALCQTLVANKQPDYAETLAKQVLASDKSYAPIYDFLYGYYLRANRTADAEAILTAKVASDPKSGNDLAQLAAHYYMTKQNDKVTATLNQLTSRLDAIPDAYVIAGDFYFRAAEPDQALAEYKKGEDAQPRERAKYRKRKAQVLVSQGKYVEASKLVDEIIKADPKDPEGIGMRAALRLRTGNAEDIKGAIADLQGVLTRSPDAANVYEIRFSLGRAYLAKFEAEKAVADRTSLLADLDQARIQLEQSIQTAHDKAGISFSSARLALAQVDIDKGDSARAAQLIDDVILTEPNNLSAHMLRSTADVNLKKYDDARNELETVLKFRPADKNARYQLAMTNFLDGKFDAADQQFAAIYKDGDARGLLGLIDSKNRQQKYGEAMALIDAEMKKGKNENFFRYMLANTQAQAGQFNDAIANFDKLIAVSPKVEDLYIRLAETCMRAGEAQQAIAAFSRAHEIAPNETFPVLRLGIIYEGMGRLEEARQEYENVLKVQPDQPIALNNLAFLKADAGTDLDQALTLAQRANQQAPDDVNVKDTLAYIYTRKGLTDEGLRMLRDIVAKRPENATFRIHLAMALMQKGDKAGARKELAAAESNKPNTDERRKIKDLIAKVG